MIFVFKLIFYKEKPIQIYKNLNFEKFDVMKVSHILKSHNFQEKFDKKEFLI